MKRILGLFFLFTFVAFAVQDESGRFSGHVSRINPDIGLVRIRVDFVNQKYLNKNDQVEFWAENYRDRACKGYIKGKTDEYILLRVPHFTDCLHRVSFTVGAYLHMYSKDLVSNLKVGQEVVNLLLKKRLAINSKLDTRKKELDNYIEKTEAVNERYRTLQEKLKLEWQKELSHLEEDKNIAFRSYKNLQMVFDEINHKLQQYKVGDKNIKEDRWALDQKIYHKK